MQATLLYITASSKQEATDLCAILLREKLIACANILDNITSLYCWEEKLETSAECLIFAKTQATLFNRVCTRVKELHSYECPCVVSLPIESGYPPFLQWVMSETSR